MQIQLTTSDTSCHLHNGRLKSHPDTLPKPEKKLNAFPEVSSKHSFDFLKQRTNLSILPFLFRKLYRMQCPAEDMQSRERKLLILLSESSVFQPNLKKQKLALVKFTVNTNKQNRTPSYDSGTDKRVCLSRHQKQPFRSSTRILARLGHPGRQTALLYYRN